MENNLQELQELETTPEFEAIKMQIAELQEMLIVNDPEMSSYLQRIHMSLLKQPELVHILKDEQRATIIDGLMQQTGVLLTASTEKSEKASISKQLKKQTEDDI